jgi:hypothetical protein
VENVAICPHTGTKRRSRKRLAIRAMADADLLGIDFRGISNIAAMAPAVDFHINLASVWFYGLWTIS